MALALLNLQENSSIRVYIWHLWSLLLLHYDSNCLKFLENIYIHLPDSQGQAVALKHQENGLLGLLKQHTGHSKEHVWTIKSLFKSISILKGYPMLIAQEEAILADKWEQVINTGKLGTSCCQRQRKNWDLSRSWNLILLVASSVRRQSGFLKESRGWGARKQWFQCGPATHSRYEGVQISVSLRVHFLISKLEKTSTTCLTGLMEAPVL